MIINEVLDILKNVLIGVGLCYLVPYLITKGVSHGLATQKKGAVFNIYIPNEMKPKDIAQMVAKINERPEETE